MVKTSTERLWLTFLQLMLIRNLIYLLFGISFRGKWMSKQIYIWVLTGYRRQSCRSNTNSSFSKKRKKKNKWIFILCQVWENHSMMEFRWPALRYKYVSGLQEKAKNLNYLGGWMVKSRRKFSPSVINLVWKKKNKSDVLSIGQPLLEQPGASAKKKKKVVALKTQLSVL